MQVLGDIVELRPELDCLPLPWWCRAPLGLLNRTPVYVALLKKSRRIVGDVIVSVLDPNKWESIIRVECRGPDEPGVIANVLDAVKELNVALAETVTIETGEMHQAILICEGSKSESARAHVPRVMDKLTKAGFKEFRVDPYARLPLPVLKHEIVSVQRGWLQDLSLGNWLRTEFDDGTLTRVDLSRAVVSADTEKRLLRFVFPRLGSRTIKIRHSDKPGTLRQLSEVLVKCELNVLSALLRRGGQERGDSELVAVCEPPEGADVASFYAKVEQGINALPQQLRARLTFEDARAAAEVISLGKAIRPVLVSDAFFPLPGTNILNAVCGTLKKHGCRPVMASVVKKGASQEQVRQVPPAVGGIVLMARDVTSSPHFPFDLARELGYFQAQGIPVLVLAETAIVDSLQTLCSRSGVQLGFYSPVEESSLLSETVAWIRRLS
jgi:hypothetical protein